MPDRGSGRAGGPGLLLTAALILVVAWAVLLLIFPTLAAWIVGAEDPLPMPGFAFLIYFGLTSVGTAIFVTTSERRLGEDTAAAVAGSSKI